MSTFATFPDIIEKATLPTLFITNSLTPRLSGVSWKKRMVSSSRHTIRIFLLCLLIFYQYNSVLSVLVV